MKVNSKKTKVMLFNKSRKHDFPPEMAFSDKEKLEVVSVIKLVGVIVSSDLRWSENTNYICNKATQRLWTLRRLKRFNLDIFKLFDVYTKEVRSILELAVPVWHSSLTKNESRQIENVQKSSFKIILGESYISYEVACTILGAEPLDLRRAQLCHKFAKKDIKKTNTLFKRSEKTPKTRTKEMTVVEPKCRTCRYQKSSIPYLSRLLNKET